MFQEYFLLLKFLTVIISSINSYPSKKNCFSIPCTNSIALGQRVRLCDAQVAALALLPSHKVPVTYQPKHINTMALIPELFTLNQIKYIYDFLGNHCVIKTTTTTRNQIIVNKYRQAQVRMSQLARI